MNKKTKIVKKENTKKEEKWMKNSYFNVRLIIKKTKKKKKRDC
jgi:hypothetical protein